MVNIQVPFKVFGHVLNCITVSINDFISGIYVHIYIYSFLRVADPVVVGRIRSEHPDI